MTTERMKEIGQRIGEALVIARAMLSDITLDEIEELKRGMRAEEGKYHALMPMLNPTLYIKAAADPYEVPRLRLQFAEVALTPGILEGDQALNEQREMEEAGRS